MSIGQLSPTPAPHDLRALKRAICERARDFDVAPLLDLLATMGYRPAEVCFRGHLVEAPQPTLVHHIEFVEVDGVIAGPLPLASGVIALGNLADLGAEPAADERAALPPAAQVTVTVNLGLLSCRSPLPSYFQQLVRDAALGEPLVELLGILDRSLLRARLTCERPEHVVGGWQEIAGDLLRIHGLDSLVGLSWLFRHVFPELPATVERTADRLRVAYASARLGSSDLGRACLGPTTRIDVHDFQVTLHCEESLVRPGLPWLHEAERRLLTVVFPALEPVCMTLTVILELADDDTPAMLHDDRRPQQGSYLGLGHLVCLVSGEPRQVVLYRGLLPHDQADTDELEHALVAQARIVVSAPAPRDPVPAAAGAIDYTCALAVELELGGLVHRYQATVRWGVRPWFADEPIAIELRCAQLILAAPSPAHHPQVWALLRDQARGALAAALASTTLTRYGATRVTDAMVADLIARRDDGALHALLDYGVAGEVPSAAWERFVRSQR